MKWVVFLLISVFAVLLLFGCTSNENKNATTITKVVEKEINFTQVQKRITGSCDSGFAIREILENGSVVCEKIPNLEVQTVNENLTELNLTLLKANEICLNNICITEWPKCQIPSLNEVLNKGNDANWMNITNVSVISVKKICLNGTCIESWDDLKQNIKFNSSQIICDSFSATNEKICSIGNESNYDFCALTSVKPYYYNKGCKIFISNGKWYLDANGAYCTAACFKAKLE